jgi:hypothetical protein
VTRLFFEQINKEILKMGMLFLFALLAHSNVFASEEDARLLGAIAPHANCRETLRRVVFSISDVSCTKLQETGSTTCSFQGEYDMRYETAGNHAQTLWETIGARQASSIECSNWFVEGIEINSDPGTIHCTIDWGTR